MPSCSIIPPVDPQGILPRGKKNAITYPEVIELPINDLIFILNELLQVLMYVPHLDTFPKLVICLHTKNQVGLFIPEWIRDLIHPLAFA
ncbi:hypothetical protein K443DRAFT_685585 [Laccaria amethystina LaAM-08-1]|uniref:Unplaced genomic scaffold K443scaffold_419, whole genome shotgun sequence n=1 Tax=Laccaria amethystina LaAM-08-1 TaxID=1095629 RepID=A0A0C9WHX1_9AGAR|nr:hypothetical protein K443DRAFT_685585 [Laccaria amethystina LaAM-08-1]